METLSFPGLGLEINLNPVIVQITETWAIRWYGVIITLGFIVGCGYVLRNVKRFGLDMDRVLDVLLGAVMGGIVGARLYYVVFAWEEFSQNPIRIIQIWTGGLAIYGGIIGGLLVGALMCKIRKVKLLPMMDIASVGLLLGQAIGRWGNFVNMEAFGTNTSLPWGMTSPTIQGMLRHFQPRLAAMGIQVDPMMPVHPTFLYESIWCFLGAAVLIWLSKRRRFDGQMILTYAGWYGLGRAFIEGLRTDSLMLGGVRVSQMLAFLCVAASVAALAVMFTKIKKANNSDYLPLYANTPEGRAVATGTFYNGEWLQQKAVELPATAAKASQAGVRNLRPQRSWLRGEKKMAQARMNRYHCR